MSQKTGYLLCTSKGSGRITQLGFAWNKVY